MLFEKDDTETVCCKNSACNEPRFGTDGRPRRNMKMLSVGEQVAQMIATDKTRDLMKYRHNYRSIEGEFKDYFDGAAYKYFKEETSLFSGEYDVAMVLFVDGFCASKNNKGDKLTIVHLLNMNIPPEYRYQDEYMLQLAILPGPNYPKYIDTFLQPIIDEFHTLSTKGMLVQKDGIDFCRAKVNLVMATGDIPAAADLAHHSGHMAAYGCRICRIKTERHNSHTCYVGFDNDVRSRNDFISPNPTNVSVKNKEENV
jgi:hypothetical protein